MNNFLENKVVVITGAAGVLGGAMAHFFARNKACVAILDLDTEAAQKKAKEIEEEGGKAIGLKADVLNIESLKEAKKLIHDAYGPCEILINGAGGNHPKGTTTKEFFDSSQLDQDDVISFFDLDKEGISFVFNLNFLGTLLPTQVFAKDMIENGGKIINISSMNAFTPLTKIPAYSGAKAAVSNFTQWLAVHFSRVNIQVNAIAPGFFLTDQNRSLLLDENNQLTDRGQTILNHTPLSRFGKPEDLFSSLEWLCNPQSDFITGIVVPIDGGFSAFSGV